VVGKEIAVKKYVVRLSTEERAQLDELIRKGKRSAQLLTKARILLKADVSELGEGWSDRRIAAAIYFGILLLVYLSTPRDLTWHLRSSADRTMMPVDLLLAFAVISTSALRQRARIEWPWFGEARSGKVNSPSH
jgi:hypothetical protein